ncbi:hypothetical protein RE6C_03724 [Rhodopirellula europaea 6C]|uniref:Uncharacterized protein n=1 Tax=Rhodopirellula europaea 6C TaxID=1263867 RepID=M2B192_9BACT|nr:hypothetical protein RE6C_03724 [Rhodopirellula europaea 6C]
MKCIFTVWLNSSVEDACLVARRQPLEPADALPSLRMTVATICRRIVEHTDSIGTGGTF